MSFSINCRRAAACFIRGTEPVAANFWNLISYYGASPLNLLLAVIPKKFIMEGVTLILLIKIGLAGSFMALYLKNINKTGSMAVVGFSTLYALCSYVMAYYWCIMWIDAVALLPLCILGLNRLIDSGRTVMYTVTLALIIFINYYTAIMVCIFIMFYYPVLYFIKVKGGGRETLLFGYGKSGGAFGSCCSDSRCNADTDIFKHAGYLLHFGGYA